MPVWINWYTNKPGKDARIDIIFEDGRQEENYIYAGGVILLMPPDHVAYTYAQPKFWRPHVEK